ncbi:MAG: NYN domain-containing protein [Candidatus Thorarchaeota archaeon]
MSDKINPVFPPTAAVLFDGGYWNKIRQELGVHNVDLTKLSDAICQPAYRLRSYYFDGKNDKQQSFHYGLQFTPRFEVILGDLVERKTPCPHCQQQIVTQEQKRVDVQLAVQMVHLATTQQVSLIVLVAGDRDFLPSVDIAKHAGVIVRLVHGPKNTTSTDLRQCADETMELTPEFLLKFLRRSEDTGIERKISIKKSEPSVSSTISNERIKYSQNLLQKALKNTPSNPDGSILASRLGITISSIEPDWKTIYKVKSLSSLIELSGQGLVTPKYKNKVLHLFPNSHLISSDDKDLEVQKTDRAIDFLLKTLKELQAEKQTNMVRYSELGLRLSKKDPNWKKRFHVKNLDTLVERASKWVQTKGGGAGKQAGLAS